MRDNFLKRYKPFVTIRKNYIALPIVMPFLFHIFLNVPNAVPGISNNVVMTVD